MLVVSKIVSLTLVFVVRPVLWVEGGRWGVRPLEEKSRQVVVAVKLNATCHHSPLNPPANFQITRTHPSQLVRAHPAR